MKIIDILQKIANKEELPKRILVDKLEYSLENGIYFNYCHENLIGELWFDGSNLNDEVEILEEEKKIPEKIDIWYDAIKDTKLERHDTDTSIEILANMCDDLKDKYNEIIDYLKSKGE